MIAVSQDENGPHGHGQSLGTRYPAAFLGGQMKVSLGSQRRGLCVGPGDIRARVLKGPSFSPRVSESRVFRTCQGRGYPLCLGSGMRRQDSWKVCALRAQLSGEDRDKDRELDEDPVTAAASLQPTAWLRWKRRFQLQPPDRLRISLKSNSHHPRPFLICSDIWSARLGWVQAGAGAGKRLRAWWGGGCCLGWGGREEAKKGLVEAGGGELRNEATGEYWEDWAGRNYLGGVGGNREVKAGARGMGIEDPGMRRGKAGTDDLTGGGEGQDFIKEESRAYGTEMEPQLPLILP